MLDRILNERLKDNSRHRDSACGVINLAIDLQLITKSCLFDFEIIYQRLKLLAKGHKLTIAVFERISKIVGQGVDNISKLPEPFDSRANCIECIEELLDVELAGFHWPHKELSAGGQFTDVQDIVFLLHLRWKGVRLPLIELFEYTLLAFSSLFVIVDPISTVPVFLTITHGDAPEERIRVARLACCVMAVVLVVFSVLGNWLFRILGITLPAFQIAGSIVLLLVSLDMLRAQRSRVQQTPEETVAGIGKEDIAITPLAVPLLSGPGAISTVILLRSQSRDLSQQIALTVCIIAVASASFLALRISARGTQWVNPVAMKVITRLMGLLLAAVACQFIINALKELRIIPS
jgi:multiple antibiotic resistance protein